jgi:hypothetical protein
LSSPIALVPAFNNNWANALSKTPLKIRQNVIRLMMIAD